MRIVLSCHFQRPKIKHFQAKQDNQGFHQEATEAAAAPGQGNEPPVAALMVHEEVECTG